MKKSTHLANFRPTTLFGELAAQASNALKISIVTKLIYVTFF